MILYITRKFPPSVGGMQRFNDKLVHYLQKIESIELIHWGGGQWILPFFLPYAFLKGFWLCHTKKIHCIYVSDGLLSPLAVFLKWVTGKKVSVTIHGRDIAFAFKPYQMVIPWALKKSDQIICVSQYLKDECIKRGVSEKKIMVIPNGIDVEEFEGQNSDEQVALLEQQIGKSLKDTKIILNVGRLVPKKGMDIFLTEIFPQILKQRNDVICLMVGEGPLELKIKKIIETNQWQNHVFLIGFIPMDSSLLKILYRSADIFIMPNVPVSGDAEGFGIVILEAVAACVPVVAFSVDGITEAIKDRENGFLIEAGDYQKFSQTVLKLIINDKERIAAGQQGHRYVKENYSWQIIAQKYLTQFYK